MLHCIASGNFPTNEGSFRPLFPHRGRVFDRWIQQTGHWDTIILICLPGLVVTDSPGSFPSITADSLLIGCCLSGGSNKERDRHGLTHGSAPPLLKERTGRSIRLGIHPFWSRACVLCYLCFWPSEYDDWPQTRLSGRLTYSRMRLSYSPEHKWRSIRSEVRKYLSYCTVLEYRQLVGDFSQLDGEVKKRIGSDRTFSHTTRTVWPRVWLRLRL